MQYEYMENTSCFFDTCVNKNPFVMGEYNILWSTFKCAHDTWTIVLEEGGIGEMLRHLINIVAMLF